MIVVALVVGIALALCVAGWVPLVRDAVRGLAVPPTTVASPDVPTIETDPTPEAVTV